ncbi:hypothetical protein [Arthrobacter livingstonensis]|nr:hypothetical protein [Arthrobacter livingstonensis]
MRIIGTLETIETCAIEQTEAACCDYQQGFDAMRRLLPDGVRLLSVRIER